MDHKQIPESWPRRRVSVFREVGLYEGEDALSTSPPWSHSSSWRESSSRNRSPLQEAICEEEDTENETQQPRSDKSEKEDRLEPSESRKKHDLDSSKKGLITQSTPSTSQTMATSQSRSPILRTAILVALFMTLISYCTMPAKASYVVMAANAEPIPPTLSKRTSMERLWKREDSPTDVCKRWGGQSAIVNGTMYLYAGRATSDPDQTSNTWSKSRLQMFGCALEIS